MKLLFFLITFFLAILGFSQERDTIFFEPDKNYSQAEVDSLIDNHRKGKFVMKIQEIEKVLLSNKNFLGWTYYYYGMSSISYRAQKYDSVVFYANEGIKAYENARMKRDFDERFLLNLYLNRGAAQTELKNYGEAVRSQQTALDYNKKFPYKWKSFIKSNIADNHYRMGNDSISLQYLLEVLQDSVFTSLPRSHVATLLKIGNLYILKDSVQKGRKYLYEALDESNKSDYKASISTIYRDLGSSFHKESDYDQSLYHFKKAIAANDEHGIGFFEVEKENDRFIRSYVKVFEGSTIQAISELKSLANELIELEQFNERYKELMSIIIETLAIAYEKTKNSREYSNLTETALDYLDKFHELKMKKNLDNLEINYQIQERDISIAQLEQNKRQQETIIRQQQIITFSLIGFLILLSGLGFVIWRQSKLKTQYEKENLEQRLLRLQMNPHFIGNAMNNINALIAKKSKDAEKYVNNLSKLFRFILINSREEFVSLEDEIETLQSYLELESNFSKEFSFSISVGKDIDPESTIIPPMLIQPLVENAITHGLHPDTQGQVNIEIQKSENDSMLVCKIIDNGKGYSEKEVKSKKGNNRSISGSIIRERIKTLKRKFKLDLKLVIDRVSTDGGTEAKLYLPYLID